MSDSSWRCLEASTRNSKRNIFAITSRTRDRCQRVLEAVSKVWVHLGKALDRFGFVSKLLWIAPWKCFGRGLEGQGERWKGLGPWNGSGEQVRCRADLAHFHDYLNDPPRRSSVVHHLGNDAPRQSGVVHHLCNDAPRRTGVVHHLGNDAPRRTGVVHHSGHDAPRYIGAVSHVLSERCQGHPEPFQGAPRPSKALPRFNPKDLRNESETVLASSKAR